MEITLVEFNVKLPDFKLPLPDGVLCKEGPELEAIMSGRGQDNSRSEDAASSSSENNRNMPNDEDAMKRAQDALEKMQEMFKGMGQ